MTYQKKKKHMEKRREGGPYFVSKKNRVSSSLNQEKRSADAAAPTEDGIPMRRKFSCRCGF